jgi:hypothetical protein
VNKVNLNTPIAASKFYEDNKNKQPETIQEDETKSNSGGTAQSITSDTLVKGSLKSGNSIDFYYIKVTETCDVQGLLRSTNSSDFDNVCYRIVDKDFYLLGDPQEYTYENTKYHDISMKLNPGDYYVVVYRNDKSTTNQIDYTFLISYQ